MRNAKSAFGVVGALLPLLYCGGLVFYFLDLSGSPQEAVDTGLGPTVIGLGAVGLLFCIPLIFKIAKLFSRPPEPGPGGGDSGFDADEAVARYLARQASGAGDTSAPQGGGTAPRGFGRKS
jgi:hypothetical protein